MGQHHSSESKGESESCPALPTPLDDGAAIAGNFTLHQILQIVAGACGLVAIIVSMILFFQHAFNIRNPREQIKIMRLITILPIFAGVTFAGLCLGQGSLYLTPWIEVWEAICVCTFFLLVLTYIHPDPDTQVGYFEALPLWNRKKQVVGQSSGAYYKRVRIAVFQMIPVLIFLAVIECITEATGHFCINSNKPRFAHIWVTVLHGLTTTVAVIAIIGFCSRLRSELPGKHIWSQLFAFKTIIGLNFFQTFVFSIVAGQATPTDHLSYNDISVGLPSALIIIEMMGFALAFHRFYSHKPYLAGGENALSAGTVMSPWLAVAKAVNPLEAFEGMMAAFLGKAGGKRAYRMREESYGMGALKSPNDTETLVERPAEAHPMVGGAHAYEGITEYQGNVSPVEDHGFHAQGGRVGMESPPRYSRG